jgi:hypothetical protein
VTGEDNPQFVLDEYFNHHHHFDFWFEKIGELKSWREEPEREKIAPLKLPLVWQTVVFFFLLLLLDN